MEVVGSVEKRCCDKKVASKTVECLCGTGISLICGRCRHHDRDISIDLKKREVKLIVSSKEINRRRKNLKKIKLDNQTPWQELSRKFVGQLSSGACLEFAVNYDNIIKSKGLPRNSH